MFELKRENNEYYTVRKTKKGFLKIESGVFNKIIDKNNKVKNLMIGLDAKVDEIHVNNLDTLTLFSIPRYINAKEINELKINLDDDEYYDRNTLNFNNCRVKRIFVFDKEIKRPDNFILSRVVKEKSYSTDFLNTITFFSINDYDEICITVENERYISTQYTMKKIKKEYIKDGIFKVPEKYNILMIENDTYSANKVIIPKNVFRIERDSLPKNIDVLELNGFPYIGHEHEFESINKLVINNGVKTKEINFIPKQKYSICTNRDRIIFHTKGDYDETNIFIDGKLNVETVKTLYEINDDMISNGNILIPNKYNVVNVDYIPNNSEVDLNQYYGSNLKFKINNIKKIDNLKFILPLESNINIKFNGDVTLKNIILKSNKTNILDDDIATIDIEEGLKAVQIINIGKYYIANFNKNGVVISYIIDNSGSVTKAILDTDYSDIDKLLEEIENIKNKQTKEDKFIKELFKIIDNKCSNEKEKYISIYKLLNKISEYGYMKEDKEYAKLIKILATRTRLDR